MTRAFPSFQEFKESFAKRYGKEANKLSNINVWDQYIRAYPEANTDELLQSMAASEKPTIRNPGSQAVVKIYKGSESSAALQYQKDAAKMAALGYLPTSQVWAPGSYGCGSFLVALLLCFVLCGFFIFVFMLIVKPDGTLTVTYELSQPDKNWNSGTPTEPLQIIFAGENTERSVLSSLVENVLNYSLVILLLAILAVFLLIGISSLSTSSRRSLPKSTASDSKLDNAKKPAPPVKATQQNDLIQKIERLGFALDPKPVVIQNSSGNQEAQLRIWNDASGFHSAPPENDPLVNMVTVNVEIRPDKEVAKFQVKVEIIGYKSKEAIRETKRKAANAILQFEPAVPEEIKTAVISKGNASNGKWTVEHSGDNFTVAYLVDRNLNSSNTSKAIATPTNEDTKSQPEMPNQKTET